MGVTEDIFNEVVKESDIVNSLEDDCQRTFQFSIGLLSRFEEDRSYPKRLIRMFFKCGPNFTIWKHFIGKSLKSSHAYNIHLIFDITKNITFKQMFDFICLMKNCAFTIKIEGVPFSYQNFRKGYDVLGHPGSVMRCATCLNKIYPEVDYQKIFAYLMGSHYNHMMFSGTSELLLKNNCKQFIEKTKQYCEQSHLKYYYFSMDKFATKETYHRKIKNLEAFSIILMDSHQGSLQLRNFKNASPNNHLEEYIKNNIEKYPVRRIFSISNESFSYRYYIVFLGYIYDKEHNEGAFCSLLFNEIFNYKNFLQTGENNSANDEKMIAAKQAMKKNLEELFETKDERKRRILAESD